MKQKRGFREETVWFLVSFVLISTINSRRKKQRFVAKPLSSNLKHITITTNGRIMRVDEWIWFRRVEASPEICDWMLVRCRLLISHLSTSQFSPQCQYSLKFSLILCWQFLHRTSLECKMMGINSRLAVSFSAFIDDIKKGERNDEGAIILSPNYSALHQTSLKRVFFCDGKGTKADRTAHSCAALAQKSYKFHR